MWLFYAVKIKTIRIWKMCMCFRLHSMYNMYDMMVAGRYLFDKIIWIDNNILGDIKRFKKDKNKNIMLDTYKPF